MTDWPVYATVTGPIVMVGFGSIGKGTLPMIESIRFSPATMFWPVELETSTDRGLPAGSQLEFVSRAVLADAIQGRQTMDG